ncbi:hypothetical protein Nepgr_013675 [Nepenthes gracilis]|uniref:Uncharacterized protein n=1 Tax=Nepenthes gracilis TaxID=150966 RepID=A0AAD3XPD8_NEPGR|nr:hypothetical protein Nepgr_013675 [Nepenthes gracilis]
MYSLNQAAHREAKEECESTGGARSTPRERSNSYRTEIRSSPPPPEGRETAGEGYGSADAGPSALAAAHVGFRNGSKRGVRERGSAKALFAAPGY